MITRCDYLGEQVVPIRIHYVNLGEKVLKHKQGRYRSERRCENRVIHRGPGWYLHPAKRHRDRISLGLRRI